MKSKVIISVISIGVIFSGLFLYPIGKLFLKDTKVSKSLFSDRYYVKISSDESEDRVVSKYLENQGWIENEDKRMGGELVFEKDGEEMRICNNDFKTIIIDGKLKL